MADNSFLTQTLFNKHASHYDQTRRLLIPPYESFYGTLLQLLLNHPKPLQKVLDMGAGTGLLAEMVLSVLPDAHVTLLDISEEMLAISRQRFANQPQSVSFQVGDYAQTPLAGPYDAIVSALSIHHVEGEGKLQVFRQCWQALCEGGIFINADQVLGSQPAVEEHYRKNWLQRVRQAGVSEETLAAAQERMLADRMSPLEDQLTWMQEAGFVDVHCWFKDFSFVVYSGSKPL
ncbi:MAG: methyltransferase domain-containing protein [Magnetococcales bacterium]|nr:methyltransferase domain-containing protein [Magnetococcales bacterium]NGZ26641.1 methyltransferase domain-containing protein [Magnetococcales bacterium]